MRVRRLSANTLYTVPFAPVLTGAVHTTQCREVGVRGKALFESNAVSGSGGAFYGGSCDKVELQQAEFRSNYATWGGEMRTVARERRRASDKTRHRFFLPRGFWASLQVPHDSQSS